MERADPWYVDYEMEPARRLWLNEAVDTVFGDEADTVKDSLRDLGDGIDSVFDRVEDTVKRRLKFW